MSSKAEAEALVEGITGQSRPAKFDILPEGTKLQIADGAELLLGYPASCVQERIRGGTILIGANESQVSGGAVERSAFDCGVSMVLAENERQVSGASVWRTENAQGHILVSDLSPVLALGDAPAFMTIVRTDLPGSQIRIASPGSHLDLAERGIKLEPGGIYEIAFGDRRAMIEVDFEATKAGGPLLTRFVKM
ncbi:MAG: hypothetical protein AAGE80_19460 [Pseudomonadota bacterium]